MTRDRSEEPVGRTGKNLADAANSASDARKAAHEIDTGDDRGGSRDGERLEPGDAGDREQLDNDGGRTQSRR